MLPFINHGMENEADKGSFLLEFRRRSPKKDLASGFYCILCETLSNHDLFDLSN